MKTTYLGLELSSPIIVSSSPYTATLDNIRRCADHGAGAVVLKSIFEEQIVRHAAALEQCSDTLYGDAAEYLHRYVADDYETGFLQLIAEARRQTALPVIASINCIVDSAEWVGYSRKLEEAGASAIELNIFFQPTAPGQSAEELEKRYAGIVANVCRNVRIPVSVKLPMRLTNLLRTADSLLAVGARGVVLFNRFFEPDVDIERMAFVESSPYSDPSEIRNVLRSAALCAGALPQLDLSVSTGVHDGQAAVKALLCGASAVQICTAIHRNGYETIGRMNETIDDWAERHGFDSVDAFRGRLDFRNHESELFHRIQYMKYFPDGTH